MRQRLNDSTDELDKIKKDFAELQSLHNGVAEELTRAKSDREYCIFLSICANISVKLH